MAVGKTTVGRLLAASLGWALVDSDEQIGAREGITVRELQAQRGREALHALEAQLLLDALASPQPAVVCAAASTIEDPRCRAALGAPAVVAVWLQARPATLVARYDADPHRPRYPEGTAAALAEQSASRTPLFAAVADATVAIDELEPRQAAERVLSLIRPFLSGGPGGMSGRSEAS